MQGFDEAAKPVIVDLDQRRRLRQEQQGDVSSISEAVSDASFCPRCKNAGYVRQNVPFGHPDFGKAIECECKKARKRKAYRQLLWEQSNLDRLIAFREASFATFQFRVPGVLEAYEAAMEFADMPQGWLLLAGINGCGKTHLAVSIAKRCLEHGAVVLFATIPDLLEGLRSTFSSDGEECYDEEFKKIREAEVLILDDLGMQQSTPWAEEKLFQLLNYRYSGRLATVFTTNKAGLEGIAPALRSRLRDRRLVRAIVMDAQDFRQLEV